MTRDEKQMLVAIAIQFALQWVTLFVIGDKIGFVIWLLGTIIQGMYIYYEDLREQARKRERTKVKHAAEHICRAYEKYERSFEKND